MALLRLIVQLVWTIGWVQALPIITNDGSESQNIHFKDNKTGDSSSGTRWSYTDVDEWSNTFDTCGSDLQSPINIDSMSLFDGGTAHIRFGNYDVIREHMQITNNGHTVLLNMASNRLLPYITDGGLSGTSVFHSLHFHWGSDSTKGSEHRIQSRQFPAELHIVHYNSKYESLAEAADHADGLAVLGILIEVGRWDNAKFQSIIDALHKVSEEGTESSLNDSISLIDLLPESTDTFYRYAGSLTTPSCNQVVTWTVFDTPTTLSEYQLSRFRQLMSDNFRPTQQLNGRQILIYFD